MKLESFYLERFIDHLKWDKNLNEMLLSGKVQDVQDDPHKCKLGAWYYPYIRSGEFNELPESLKKTMLKLENPHELLHASVIDIKARINEGKIQAARGMYASQTEKHLAEVKGIINEINKKIHAIAGDRRREMEANGSRNNTMIITAFIIGAAVLLGVLLMAFRSLGILNMLKPFNEQFALAALGDLTVRYPLTRVNCSQMMQCGKTTCPDYGKDAVLCWFDVGSYAPKFGKEIHCPKILNGIYKTCQECRVYKTVNTNEVTTLAAWYNKFVENLHALISGIRTSTFGLNVVVQQISGDNENLSQRTSQQATSLEEIASTIEEATATINQNSEHSREANEKSEEAARVVQDAKDLSAKSIHLAESGGEIVTRAVDAINEINKSSKRISEILKVINDIAFQTNLLALNAAVEAARAGDQGRGFAVVAGEVRNLAQRSAGAANEISEIISDSINKIELGTDLVAKSGEALVGIIESAKKSGEALEGVISSVSIVGQLISEIAAASQEQKQGINQINVAISEIDNTTQQNASLVEETASASEEMANQAQFLLSLVEQFKTHESAMSGDPGSHSNELRLNQLREPAKPGEKSGVAPGNGNGRKIKPQVEPHVVHSTESKAIREIMKKEGFNEF
jgi:methyl-accepting chemotaxis protein